MQTFYIEFSNKSKITFGDIIDLNTVQKGRILSYARKYEEIEITTAKSGVKVKLTQDQKEKIISAKERLVSDKTAIELHEMRIIEFTDHSIDRIIKRYKGNLVECYLAMIDSVKKSKEIHNLAEWKGYISLAYTFLHTIEDLIKNKIVVTFVRNGDNMKIITVMNDEVVDSMDYRLSEDDEAAKMLLRFRGQLKDGYNQ